MSHQGNGIVRPAFRRQFFLRQLPGFRHGFHGDLSGPADKIKVFLTGHQIHGMGFNDAAALISNKGSHIKIVPDFLFRLLQVALNQPVRKHGRFLNVRAFQHDDGNAAGFDCHVHIHVALGTLIQIDILGIPAAAGNDHVRLLCNGNTADFQQIFTALVKRCFPVTGYHFVQTAFACENNVQ